MKAKTMLIALTALFLIGTLGAADADNKDDVTQDVPHGKVNWTKQYVYATGSGAPDLKAPNVAVARLGAERTAKLDAMRNLLEAIKGVGVTGSTTVSNSMETSMEVKSHVEGVVKGMEIVTTKYYSDGGVDVTVRVPLSTISEKIQSSGAADTAIQTKETVAQPKQAEPAAVETSKGGDKKDVLVLDVRGAKFTPALFPVVYTEDGKVVYSKKQVRDEVLKTKGMIHYVKDDLDSVKMMYGDAVPMLVLKVGKIKNKSDIIVGSNDVSAIQSKLNGDTLAEGKVVILF